MDAALLKQRLAHQYFADLLQTLRMPLPQALETIVAPERQQRLNARYDQLRQRTQTELMQLHIRTAEMKAEECQEQYDAVNKLFERDQRDHHAYAQLTTAMHFILKQRFKLIEERLTALYDLKVRFFARAPTVKTSI